MKISSTIAQFWPDGPRLIAGENEVDYEKLPEATQKSLLALRAGGLISFEDPPRKVPQAPAPAQGSVSAGQLAADMEKAAARHAPAAGTSHGGPPADGLPPAGATSVVRPTVSESGSHDVTGRRRDR